MPMSLSAPRGVAFTLSIVYGSFGTSLDSLPAGKPTDDTPFSVGRKGSVFCNYLFGGLLFSMRVEKGRSVFNRSLIAPDAAADVRFLTLEE